MHPGRQTTHLDGEWTPLRRAASADCLIGRCQLALNQCCGPAIRDGVMHVTQQQVQLLIDTPDLAQDFGLSVITWTSPALATDS